MKRSNLTIIRKDGTVINKGDGKRHGVTISPNDPDYNYPYWEYEVDSEVDSEVESDEDFNEDFNEDFDEDFYEDSNEDYLELYGEIDVLPSSDDEGDEQF